MSNNWLRKSMGAVMDAHHRVRQIRRHCRGRLLPEFSATDVLWTWSPGEELMIHVLECHNHHHHPLILLVVHCAMDCGSRMFPRDSLASRSLIISQQSSILPHTIPSVLNQVTSPLTQTHWNVLCGCTSLLSPLKTLPCTSTLF